MGNNLHLFIAKGQTVLMKLGHIKAFMIVMLFAAFGSISFWMSLQMRIGGIPDRSLFDIPKVLVDRNDPYIRDARNPDSYVKLIQYPNVLIEQYFQIAAQELASGGEDRELAVAMERAGWEAYDIGRTALTEVYFRRALEIREKTLNPTDPDLARAHMNLAEFYRTFHHHAYAASHYAHCLNATGRNMYIYPMAERYHIDQGHKARICLGYCGHVLFRLQKEERHHGSTFAANLYRWMSHAHQRAREPGNAQEFLHRALEYYHAALHEPEDMFFPTFHVLFSLGKIYADLGENDRAVQYYFEALKIPNSPGYPVLRMFSALIEILVEQESPEQIEKAYELMKTRTATESGLAPFQEHIDTLYRNQSNP